MSANWFQWDLTAASRVISPTFLHQMVRKSPYRQGMIFRGPKNASYEHEVHNMSLPDHVVTFVVPCYRQFLCTSRGKHAIPTSNGG